MKIDIIKPLDGPIGTKRLIELMIKAFNDPSFNSFKMISAFAKIKPLIKLNPYIAKWKQNNNLSDVIFGIDHYGTSIELLTEAINVFDNVYITHNPIIGCTFHPKIYLWSGSMKALAVIGSQNFTVGGLETNYETSIIIDLDLKKDKLIWDNIYECWDQLTPQRYPNTKLLNRDLLKQLINQDLIVSETLITQTKTKKAETESLFPVNPPVAPAKIPKEFVKSATEIKEYVSNINSLVIQILPHRNGEIFLSMRAVKDNPKFFGFPFTGKTKPKYKNNPSYPQREPDPSALLFLFDNDAKCIYKADINQLNMVYYERKADIRITINPSIARSIDPYSILVMHQSNDKEHDYLLEIYKPGSKIYQSYLSVCDITLPSGGKSKSRKMGWQ